MKIGSIIENQTTEKRISITPEIVKKYHSLGFEIFLEENYASHLGISDSVYELQQPTTTSQPKSVVKEITSKIKLTSIISR